MLTFVFLVDIFLCLEQSTFLYILIHNLCIAVIFVT